MWRSSRVLWGLCAASALAVGLSWPGSASAYSYLQDPDGTPLRWERLSETGGTMFARFRVRTTNANGVARDSVRELTTQGLLAWQRASGGMIGFTVTAGDDAREFPASIEGDGVSSIHFASAAADIGPLDGSVLAYTQLHLDPDTRRIVEADIILNDLAFTFTDDPEVAAAASEATTVYLGDVITHELGHAFGLQHSGVLSSTMLTWDWPDQSRLACDDMAAIQSAYPDNRFIETGELVGGVRGPAGLPVKGAQVTAVSLTRRAPFAAALTDAQGVYRIEALPPDDYALMLEPFVAGPTALSSYFQDIDHGLCAGALFSRSFQTEYDGRSLRAYAVEAGVETSTRPMTVGCEPSGEAFVVDVPAGTDRDLSAEVILSPELPRTDMIVPLVTDSSRRYYRLSDVSGDVALTMTSFSLWSAGWATLELFAEDGRSVSTAVAKTPAVDDETTGYRLYDAVLVAEDLDPGDYYLAIRAGRLPSSSFPRGDLAQDPGSYGWLSAELNPEVSLDDLISGDLSDCRDVELGAYYIADPGLPGMGCAGGRAQGPGLLLGLLGALLWPRRRSACAA